MTWLDAFLESLPHEDQNQLTTEDTAVTEEQRSGRAEAGANDGTSALLTTDLRYQPPTTSHQPVKSRSSATQTSANRRC